VRRFGTGMGPFPLPVIDQPFRPRSHSRRLQLRFKRAQTITSLANSAVHSLNSLNSSFSRPSIFPFRPQAGNPSPFVYESSSQSRMVANIFQSATRFYDVSRRAVCPSGQASVCDDSGDNFYLSSYFGSGNVHSSLDTIFNNYLSVPSAAVPLVADRVSLPTSAGSVDLLDLLPPDMAKLYSGPDQLLVSEPPTRKPPRAVLCASADEYLKLVRKLYGKNMVEFTDRPTVVNGVFGVAKDADSIRLIIDARPANAAFVVPPKVQLPTPDLLAKLTINPEQPLFVAKVDLDNFYHRIRLPQWIRSYFALPPVRAEQVGLELQYGNGTWVYPCCTTLPMGWSHSVLVAQSAHEHILNSMTMLQPQDRITTDSDLRIDRLRHQVYIDDLNLFGPDRDVIARAQQQYIDTVVRLGLPVKPSKVVEPTQDGVECVGLEVNGRRHDVGLRGDKLWKLCADTCALLDYGQCTGLELAQLVGRWTWASLSSRPVLSVFSSVYRFIECARSRTFVVWSSVENELRHMVNLAPLMVAKLSDGWFHRVIATDASETGQGVVSAWVDPSVVVETAGAKIPHITDEDSRPTSIDPALASANWRVIVASQWQQPEHINSLELRAVSTAVRWALSSPMSIHKRLLILSDSLVTVYSVTKGRSSSRLLLPRLRQLASLVLASGIRLYVRWIPTELNPADEPSRRFQYVVSL
jgi:hypothetical protein